MSDPHNVQIVFSNRLLVVGNEAHVINVTLGVARFSAAAEGHVEPDVVVSARLRLDLPTAMGLVAALKDQLDKITGSNDPKH